MITKLEHVLSTLDDADLSTLISVVPTKLFGGAPLHTRMLQKWRAGKMKFPERIPQKDRQWMSELVTLIEKYLVVRESLRTEMHQEKVLLRHYRQMENEKLFTELYAEAEKKLSFVNHHAAIHQHRSDIQFEKWQFDQLHSRFSNTEAADILQHEEVALISRLLMQVVALAPQASLLGKKVDTTLLETIEPYIHEKNYLDFPCISLYYYAFKLVSEPDSMQWFEFYARLLEEYQQTFPEEEMKTLYFQAINYCIRRHNSGDRTFSSRLLEYYIKALHKGYLLTNGYLSKNTYRNINTIAIRMGQYDVAMRISSEYVHTLRHEDQENAYHFNMANIHYARQEYDKALDALRYAEFDDHLSNLFAKTLMIKIYYEMGTDRLLDAHLDAMQVYLTRKKIIGYHKTNYSNIVRYTRRLVRLNPFDRQARITLADQIRQEKVLPDRDWLLRMVEK
ncbi:MAG: hypothetical protein LW630_05750 [Saprospiraceae bacterium]|jgi:tetratricopeptide (TPR) repeat protein|nr:hypothetical protein [Saprospiraceae bacterium]